MKTPYTCKQNLPLADRSEMESIKRESQSYFWLSILICVISFILLIVYVADSVVDRSYEIETFGLFLGVSVLFAALCGWRANYFDATQYPCEDEGKVTQNPLTVRKPSDTVSSGAPTPPAPPEPEIIIKYKDIKF